jgi:ascorbate-specific PTS system EIIC-type component UlaA
VTKNVRLSKGTRMLIDSNTATTLFALGVFFVVIIAIAYQTYKLVKKDNITS